MDPEIKPYKIITTLGPATHAPPAWTALLEAGATGFRLNTSHLSLSELNEWLDHLASFRVQKGGKWQVCLDLQGSKWRLGRLPAQELAPGQRVELRLSAEAETRGVLPVPHADFFRAAALSNGEIVLNDARVRLKLVGDPGSKPLAALVTQGGPLASARGITYSESGYRQESLSEKDQAILHMTTGLDFVRYAISYVRDAGELRAYQALAAPSVEWIAKIERRPAVQAAASLAELAEEVWICRGDLGAELGLAGMAEATSLLIAQAPKFATPVLLAGQVFEHLTSHPTPTRAEICHLHTALAGGCAGVVLSDETAIGQYPVAAVAAAALFQASRDGA